MSPWVSVGPSSTTSTRLPFTAAGLSTVTGLSASMMVALGFIALMLARTVAISLALAVSTLLITTTSAMRRLAAPGWKVASWPERSGSVTVICRSGL
jgi:hypothetical protein